MYVYTVCLFWLCSFFPCRVQTSLVVELRLTYPWVCRILVPPSGIEPTSLALGILYF